MIKSKEYKLNFEKIKMSSECSGVYWNKVPKDIVFRDYIIREIKDMKKNKKWKYQPFLYINEMVEEHHTQFLYMLKEEFTTEKEGFTGWETFAKEDLQRIANEQAYIYRENFENGSAFVNKFPEKIDEFIEKFFDCIN